MKLARFAMLLSILFPTSPLVAQGVKPSSLVITAVPSYSSTPQNVDLFNTGSEEITVTVSISGSPFAIYENRCGHGVKPGTHCNVDVIYTPQALGNDYGTLTFVFANGQTVVPLTGNAVTIIPTDFIHFSHSGATLHFKLSAAGDIIPNGEQIYVSCIDYEGVNETSGNGPLKNNMATVGIRGNDDWECTAWYNGDSEFAYSYYANFWVNLCHPVKACHDDDRASGRPDEETPNLQSNKRK